MKKWHQMVRQAIMEEKNLETLARIRESLYVDLNPTHQHPKLVRLVEKRMNTLLRLAIRKKSGQT